MAGPAAVRVAAWGALVPVLLAACQAPVPAPVSERSLVDGPTPSVYTVQKYDTLYSVAWRYELDVERLAERNGIEAPDEIEEGQRLVLTGTAPAGPAVVVPSVPIPGKPATDRRGGESARSPVAANPPTPKPDVVLPKPTAVPAAPAPKPQQAAKPLPPAAAANPPPKAAKPSPTASAKPPPAAVPAKPAAAKPAAPRPVPPASAGSGAWRPPVDAKPSRGFGGGSKGYDYSLPKGTLIRAASPGTVVYAGPAGPRIGPFRHLVIVKPRDGILVAYGVNVQPSLKNGDTVRVGDMVARAGSGRSGGQFHFEVRDRGTPVDPGKFIRG